MRVGWEVKRLGEVCDLIARGVAPSYIDDGGMCVLNQKCVRDHQVNYELARRHNAAAKRVDPERFLKAGDVLINSTGTGTLGRVAQVREEPPEPATVDTHVTIVRPQAGRFYPDFFGYMLIQIEDEIAASGEGASGQTELARSVIENRFQVSFPTSLAEQKRIVAILDEAFAGIAAATANAEKNLANARELFDGHLKSLFDEEHASWERKTLSQAALDFGRGKSKHRPRNDPKLYGGKHPFIQTGDVRNCDHVILDSTQTYNEFGLAQSKLWPKGTICITIAANIAETGILSFDACFPDSVIGMVVDPKQTTNDFVEYLLRSVQAQLKAAGKGSAQDNINLATFEDRLLPFPALEEQVRIVGTLNELSRRVRQLEGLYEKKLSALAELKQAILQKAFSGDLSGIKTRHCEAA